jgi:DNA mismatch repair ATPase MutS
VALPIFHATSGVICTGLYDAALVLLSGSPAVGNSLNLSDAAVTVITGANRGGKSTFLRSLGQATLLAHCGLFVPAESFSTPVRATIHTHFTREEDVERTSGRLDEELARMSSIVDAAEPGGLLLLNESFASTNEREGSEIARNVVGALRDSGVSVAFVTHLYEYASRAHAEKRSDTVFLRAGREDDGHRDFRIQPGIPLPTSFGADLYERIFGTTLDPDELQPTLPSQGAR